MPEVVARASLVPLVDSIRPGRPFYLAVELDIHPGYRVSWKYPGEIGKESVASFQAPDGFEIGPVLYPAPERFEAGGYTGYGYARSTALFVRVTPPARLSTAEAYRFDSSASWLACKKQCAREDARAFVELIADRTGGQNTAEDAMQALLERVPKPLDALPAKREWVTASAAPTLVLRLRHGRFTDYFPAAEKPAVKSAQVSDSGTELRLTLESAPNDATPLVGVVAVQTEGTNAFYDILLDSTDS